jgi:hypothetical protein
MLLAAGLLATETNNRFAPYRAAYPLAFAPVLFPGLYPASKVYLEPGHYRVVKRFSAT